MEARPGAAAPERYWRFNLALICLGALIGAFAASCITVPLQQVASDLHTSTGLASASVIVYLLVLSGLFLFFGKLGDVWGYRRVFLFGTALFALGSLLCGCAGTVNQLIIFRIIEAVGATMGAAVITPFVTCHVPEAWHGRGFAYLYGGGSAGCHPGADARCGNCRYAFLALDFFCPGAGRDSDHRSRLVHPPGR